MPYFNEADACRICHGEAEEGAPLISPCECLGSLRFVHQACLRKWIQITKTESCELCKHYFHISTEVKSFQKWHRLEMTTFERRRIFISITFHAIAIICVVWSLYALIESTIEQIKAGIFGWQFWIKLITVAAGFTCGLTLSYVQCKIYVHYCRRWRDYNSVIHIQNFRKIDETVFMTMYENIERQPSTQKTYMG